MQPSKGEKFSGAKPPVFTFCMQFKDAIAELANRSRQGHEKYIETDADWRNFERVENPDFEYSNAMFRHAIGLGEEDNEFEHYIATAWNAIARLQCYIRNK